MYFFFLLFCFFFFSWNNFIARSEDHDELELKKFEISDNDQEQQFPELESNDQNQSLNQMSEQVKILLD